MTESTARAVLSAAVSALIFITVFVVVVLAVTAFAGCAYEPGSTGGDNAPEVHDAGAGPVSKGFSTSPALAADRALAVALCEGECHLRRAASCDTLDSSHETGLCLSGCPRSVAALPDRCVDPYVALRLCYAHSPAPVFVCSAAETSYPVPREPGLCTTELLDVLVCRLVS